MNKNNAGHTNNLGSNSERDSSHRNEPGLTKKLEDQGSERGKIKWKNEDKIQDGYPRQQAAQNPDKKSRQQGSKTDERQDR